MPTKNCYVVLGVSRDESSAGIRSGYHELARRMHPDIAGPADTSRLQEINESYEVLSDPDRRRAHRPRLRRAGARHGSAGPAPATQLADRARAHLAARPAWTH